MERSHLSGALHLMSVLLMWSISWAILLILKYWCNFAWVLVGFVCWCREMYKTRYAATKWSKFLMNQSASLRRWRWMRWLDERNVRCSESVLQKGGPVLSLTTFGTRLQQVYYTLESIGAGRLRPSRLVLWVSPNVAQDGLPIELVRLQKRGLEVCACDDVGPHTKYFHAVNHGSPSCDLVTADDDVLYPSDWLELLVLASQRLPETVVAHRARVIRFQSTGVLAPYTQWSHCASSAASALNFALGVGGVLYPVNMQKALRAAGDGFARCCPRADDVWLKAIALRNETMVAQIASAVPEVINLPGARLSGLARKNVAEGGNDVQIDATFSASEIECLRRLSILETRT